MDRWVLGIRPLMESSNLSRWICCCPGQAKIEYSSLRPGTPLPPTPNTDNWDVVLPSEGCSCSDEAVGRVSLFGFLVVHESMSKTEALYVWDPRHILLSPAPKEPPFDHSFGLCSVIRNPQSLQFLMSFDAISINSLLSNSECTFISLNSTKSVLLRM